MRFKNTMTHLEKTQRETYSQVHHIEWQVATISLWFLLSFYLLAKRQCWLLPSPKRNTHLGGSGLVVYQRSLQSRRKVLNWKTILCIQIGNCASSLFCPCRSDVEGLAPLLPWTSMCFMFSFFKECFKVSYSFSICLSHEALRIQ